MNRFVKLLVVVWLLFGCGAKKNGTATRALPVETVEAEAVLTLAQGHTGAVVGVEVLSDGRILSYSEDGTLRIWSGVDGVLLQTLEGHTEVVNGVEVLSDGRLLSYSSSPSSGDSSIRIWNVTDGTLLHTLEGHT